MPNAPKPIVIIGAGGHAKEVRWLIDDLNSSSPEWSLLGFLDTQRSGKKEHFGYAVFDGYETVSSCFGQPFFACGMGTPAIRLKESQSAEELGWQPAVLVHPTVVRAGEVAIGDGTTIGAGAILGPCCCVGRHCLINTHASVGHDASVGNFSVISPGARILGSAILEAGVFVGANASVYPGCRMGTGATLGANSFLQSDLPAGNSSLGVVAKVFQRPAASTVVGAPDLPHVAIRGLKGND